MKKSTIFLVSMLIVLGSVVNAGELSFEDFKNLVTKNIVLDGFALDKSRTFDMKSSFRMEFKGDEEKMEMISIWLFPATIKFSQQDLKVGKPESYKYQGRSALYSDGNKAGMAGFKLLLNNNKGKLAISHRVFGGKFLGKADFEKIVEQIGLENLEK
jgi:hypothetical protein